MATHGLRKETAPDNYKEDRVVDPPIKIAVEPRWCRSLGKLDPHLWVR